MYSIYFWFYLIRITYSQRLQVDLLNKYILPLICFARMDFSEQYHMYRRRSLRQSNITCIEGKVWDRAISHVSKAKSETEQYYMCRRWSLRQSNIISWQKGPFQTKLINDSMLIEDSMKWFHNNFTLENCDIMLISR